MDHPFGRRLSFASAFLICAIAVNACAQSSDRQHKSEQIPEWKNAEKSPDARADMVLRQMTLEEKLSLIHGMGMPGWGKPMPTDHLGNGGAGFVMGIPRLEIPFIQMSDAAYGVRSSGDNGRYSTALPSNLASAASWDTQAACDYGTLIGRELRAQGYNMTLGGGVNLTREPRNGRTFEYMGEDPILAGALVGNRIKCEQSQHVIGDIKHYTLNDQESGRDEVNATIDKRALREGDMLAFEIGIATGNPGAVMCSYNSVNGDYACENKYLLTDVLKKEWNFKGFVVSDWGGTHSAVKASAAGLDNEEPRGDYFGEPFRQALKAGKIPMAELDEHVRRILRSEFASGIVDHPMQKGVVDVEAGFETARRLAEQSTVLLKNSNGVLPLDRATIRSIAIIGPHADTGMISGGGSAQVDPPGGPPTKWLDHVWFLTSPLKAVSTKIPGVNVQFDSGSNEASAAALAKESDVVIIFAYQWASEGMDLPNLSLPEAQDALIEQVAAANPRTIVVLETGTAATMPWSGKVSGILEAWYAGSKGAEAVANILFGDVNPSAKLPITFPRSEADLPHPQLVQPPAGSRINDDDRRTLLTKPTFSVHYDEGLKVGYKWYDAEKKPVLFPFGFGLSYTTYSYSDLKVSNGTDNDKDVTVAFTVKNAGTRDGAEIAQVYSALPVAANEPPKRLVGWSKVFLKAGESKEVNVTVPSKYLSIFDEAGNGWKQLAGSYSIMVGGSSQDLPLVGKISVN